MDYKWSLKELYSSFEGEDFKKDLRFTEEYVDKFNAWVDELINSNESTVQKLVKYINKITEGREVFSKLFAFAELTLSVDTKNQSALKNLEILEQKIAGLAEGEAKLNKWVGSIDNISEAIKSNKLLKEHEFYLMEIKEFSKYLLSEKEEAIIAMMKNTGSSAWSKLNDLLTSTLKIEIELNGEKQELPLSVVRNMAYENDRELRKKAYDAELASYNKIEDGVAAALNGIKGEVITITKLRGYKSPLEEALISSRMDKESLDAMFEAMRESFPSFRKYFKKKAELLGSKNGLPFYDLFAPMGNVEMKFDYEKGKKFVEDNFRTFSDKLADYAKKAFDNNWIDVMPREGKVGGAFCHNIQAIKESRIMLNYGNTFSDVVTMAHELGHGYHGECLKDEHFLNSDYPMPIAETASTFCETIIKKAAIKNASQEEAFSILENEISDCAQVIVDIYSRFLFESEVFEKRAESSLSASELKEIMIKAQKEAYGDGLDENYLHPYMWACKPHYYSASTSFYNYPYAFGLLFAKGLYVEYLKRGKDFVEDYDKLLSVTGKNKIADITKLMRIDIHSIEFWKNSLKTVEEDIDKFIELSK